MLLEAVRGINYRDSRCALVFLNKSKYSNRNGSFSSNWSEI